MSFDAARDGWDVVCLAGHGNFYCLRMIPAMLHDRTALSCQVSGWLWLLFRLTFSGILTVSISEA